MYQRANGTWCEAITLPSGKKKFFYGKTKADVKKKMSAWNEEDDKKWKFEALAKEWMTLHESQTSYNTACAYKAVYNRTCEHFRDRYAKDITADEIQSYINAISGMGYARRTVQMHRDLINMVFMKVLTLQNL